MKTLWSRTTPYQACTYLLGFSTLSFQRRLVLRLSARELQLIFADTNKGKGI